MIAEKMTGEKSRDYMNARRVAKEYEAITRGLDRAFLSLPPCGSIEEIKQVIYFLLFYLGNYFNFTCGFLRFLVSFQNSRRSSILHVIETELGEKTLLEPNYF